MSCTILLQCISNSPLYTDDSQVNKTLPLVQDKIGNIPGRRKRRDLIKGENTKKSRQVAFAVQ